MMGNALVVGVVECIGRELALEVRRDVGAVAIPIETVAGVAS